AAGVASADAGRPEQGVDPENRKAADERIAHGWTCKRAVGAYGSRPRPGRRFSCRSNSGGGQTSVLPPPPEARLELSLPLFHSCWCQYIERSRRVSTVRSVR